jgi:hypothetical protein
MSATTLNYPNVIPVRRASAIGWILILTCLALLAVTILSIVSSTTRDAYPVGRTAISQNAVIPIPVPTPPTAVIQPIPSETPAPSSTVASDPNIVPVPVPTP